MGRPPSSLGIWLTRGRPGLIDEMRPLLLLRSCLVHCILVRRDGIRFYCSYSPARGRSSTGGTRSIGLDQDDFGSRSRHHAPLAYWCASATLLASRSASRRFVTATQRNRYTPLPQAYRAAGSVSVRRLPTISRSAGMISARS